MAAAKPVVQGYNFSGCTCNFKIFLKKSPAKFTFHLITPLNKNNHTTLHPK